MRFARARERERERERDNAYSKKCFQNRGMDRLASIMYCFSTKPFPETGELTNSTFHSAVILSKPMHVFSAPRILFYLCYGE